MDTSRRVPTVKTTIECKSDGFGGIGISIFAEPGHERQATIWLVQDQIEELSEGLAKWVEDETNAIAAAPSFLPQEPPPEPLRKAWWQRMFKREQP